MNHVVSLSGGTASAVVAHRVIERYGLTRTTLWFADTSWEDEDLYRFLNDLESFLGVKIVRHVDGRTPLEVAEKASIIPNQRRAPCSLQLKIKPFRKFLAEREKPLTIHLGFDWTEEHRMIRPKAEYEQLGFTVDFPLMWKPLPNLKYYDIVKSWGIRPPRLYDLGFPHNNCGGRCVKQGLAEWMRLRAHLPERFKEVRDWEQAQRAKGGARANYAIARDRTGGEVTPLPLAKLEERAQTDQYPLFSYKGDGINCFCAY